MLIRQSQCHDFDFFLWIILFVDVYPDVLRVKFSLILQKYILHEGFPNL